MELSQALIVPLVIALVGAIKAAPWFRPVSAPDGPRRNGWLLPWIAAVLGVGLSLLWALAWPADPPACLALQIVMGLIFGLSAAGLYDATLSPLKGLLRDSGFTDDGLMLLLAAGLAFAVLGVGGCGAPAALERSQELQLAQTIQYRDEMASYHEKACRQLLDQKRAELDLALAQSLSQSADATGKIDMTVATDRLRKRLDLEEEYRRNLARLDGEFRERQTAINRAIRLGEGSLDLMRSWSRVGTLLRSLFVREIEAQEAVAAAEPPKASPEPAPPPTIDVLTTAPAAAPGP
ncbi:MAG: hypothetical protein NTX87_10355 [Planctomycetota bacterium]|nr:hypothetical protein [Planctomycetota bacterium]